MTTKERRKYELIDRMRGMGFSMDDALAIRRIEMTLQRWAELECGDSNDYVSFGIERDEVTGKPFMVIHPHTSDKSRRYAVADREAGALRRLAAIMERHPDYIAYHQTDPRGCAVYIVAKSALNDGASIESVYTRGLAICA